MSYEQAKQMFVQYAQHNQKGFRDEMFSKKEFELAFPTITGPTGVGKTASVERYAKESKLLFGKWDAEGMGVGELCAVLSAFTAKFLKAKEEGAVFLIERFDTLDSASVAFLKDYVKGQASARVKMADGKVEEIVVKRTPQLNLVAEVTKG